jgi:HrpA-like RNA helicase
MLPVDPKLGKMLIMGAIFGCFGPILTIVSGLSVRDPFLLPQDKKDVSTVQSSINNSVLCIGPVLTILLLINAPLKLINQHLEHFLVCLSVMLPGSRFPALALFSAELFYLWFS